MFSIFFLLEDHAFHPFSPPSNSWPFLSLLLHTYMYFKYNLLNPHTFLSMFSGQTIGSGQPASELFHICHSWFYSVAYSPLYSIGLLGFSPWRQACLLAPSVHIWWTCGRDFMSVASNVTRRHHLTSKSSGS